MIWLWILLQGPAAGQMPPGLPGRDSYAIRKVDPNAPCRFVAEYQKIKSRKTDPRIAFLEVNDVVRGDDLESDFEERCFQLTEQTENGITFFDGARGYLHILSGSPVISTVVAYFADATKSNGVMLYIDRWDDEWKTFALAWRDGKWRNVSDQYLRPLGLSKNDLLLLPQYGRTIRVLRMAGDQLHHKRWLTWNGVKFVPLDEKTGRSTWRCPDSYRYFEPAERAVYCR